jgi:hypothetical protein
MWWESQLSGQLIWLVDTLFSVRRRGLGSLFVLKTFKSHHDGSQSLLHVPNKEVKTIIIILVLVGVARELIEWLN